MLPLQMFLSTYNTCAFLGNTLISSESDCSEDACPFIFETLSRKQGTTRETQDESSDHRHWHTESATPGRKSLLSIAPPKHEGNFACSGIIPMPPSRLAPQHLEISII